MGHSLGEMVAVEERLKNAGREDDVVLVWVVKCVHYGWFRSPSANREEAKLRLRWRASTNASEEPSSRVIWFRCITMRERNSSRSVLPKLDETRKNSKKKKKEIPLCKTSVNISL